jgi:aspartyl protease family protein
MVRYLLAAPACAILAIAAAGAATSLTADQRDLPQMATSASAVVPIKSTIAEPDNLSGMQAGHVVHQAGDGLFYAQALINGQPVRFIVDTGSSVVVLNEADAKRTGVQSEGMSQVMVQTASGETGMQMTKLNSVSIAGQTINRVDAAIVSRGLKVSLLGQSVLSRLDSVQIIKDELRLNERQALAAGAAQNRL